MTDANQRARFCPACRNPVAEADESCAECMSSRGPEGWPADPYTGESLAGRYEIVRRIGADGTGLTFLGTSAKGKDRVVVRMLAPDLAGVSGLVNRFLAEIRKVRDLRDPLFPVVLDIGTGFGKELTPYFVREYVEGESLAVLLSRDLAFDVPETLDIASRIAAGMHRAHARGLIHRHLRPDKIVFRGLRDPDPVKILDLGFAQVAPLDEVTSMGHVDALRYAPPDGEEAPVDPRVDVYALGVLIYDMVSGLPEMRSSVHGSNPSPGRLSVVRPALGKALDDLVYRMMSREAADRPATMAEVLRSIERVKKNEPGRKTESPPAAAAGAEARHAHAQAGKVGKSGTIIGVSKVTRRPNPTPVIKMAARPNVPAGQHKVDTDEMSRPTLNPPAPAGVDKAALKPVKKLALEPPEEISVGDLFGSGKEPIVAVRGGKPGDAPDSLPSLPPLPPLPLDPAGTGPGDDESEEAMDVLIEDADRAVAIADGSKRSEPSTSLTPLALTLPSEPEKKPGRRRKIAALALLGLLVLVVSFGVAMAVVLGKRGSTDGPAQRAPAATQEPVTAPEPERPVEAAPQPGPEVVAPVPAPEPVVAPETVVAPVPPPEPPAEEVRPAAKESDSAGVEVDGAAEKKKKKKKGEDPGTAATGDKQGSKEKDEEWEMLFIKK